MTNLYNALYNQNGTFKSVGTSIEAKYTVNKNNRVFYLQVRCKQYELANHLGNVLVTVSDRKENSQLTSNTGFNTDDDIINILSITIPMKNSIYFESQSITHFKSGYCYGSENCFFSIKKNYNFVGAQQFIFLIQNNSRQSVMQERTYSALAYRPDLVYVAIFSKKSAHNILSEGFNNQEQDAEMGVPTKNIVYFVIMKNTTNAKMGYAFEYRIHNARLGRFGYHFTTLHNFEFDETNQKIKLTYYTHGEIKSKTVDI